MLSTPFICCSIGVETAWVTVLASAPGYVAVTRISGGTMLGYCEIGSVSIDTAPMMTVRIAMTMATMGLRMKNLDMVYLPAGGAASEDNEVVNSVCCGLTGAPSRSFWRLSVMTSAPPARPLSITQLLPY